jgi:AraC-like DNA-binding protein
MVKPFIEAELLARTANLLSNYRRRKTQEEDLPEPVEAEPETGAQGSSPENLLWLEELEAKVRPYLQKDTLSVEWIAAQVFMSERQLYRRLKALTGLTVNEYIREMRLQEARYLLENRLVDSVKKAAHSVCFQDVKYFTQIFKARFGKNPSEI